VSGTDYEFDWDDNKAAINLGKHGVDFREAMTVMLDPLAMTFLIMSTARMKSAGSAWDAAVRGRCSGGAYGYRYRPQ